MQHWGVPRLSAPQQLQLCPSFPSFTSFHCNSSKHASTRGSSDGPLIFYGWSSCNREYGMKKRCTGLKPLTADPYRRDRLPVFALVTFPHLFPPPSSLPSTLIPHSGSAFVTTQKGCILWPVPRQYLQAHSLPCTGLRKLTAIGTVRCPFPRKGKGGAATQAQASKRGRSVKALAWVCRVYILPEAQPSKVARQYICRPTFWEEGLTRVCWNECLGRRGHLGSQTHGQQRA